MTPEQIAELFVQAAETDRRLPDTARPARLKAMSLPYVHSDKDQAGWGAERYQLERAEFFTSKGPTKNQVGLWEAAMEMIKLVAKPENRRSLWAWASAKAGGMPVKKWARTVEHVHPETVSRRAKASITEIHHKLCSNGDLHNQNDMNEVLPDTPEISDKTGTVRAWRDEDARPLACHFDKDIAGLEWAEMQSAKRRERDAKRRQQQAA